MSVLFVVAAGDPKEEQRKEIMKLKRRFLKDRKVTSAFFARSQSRQKIAREVSTYCTVFPLKCKSIIIANCKSFPCYKCCKYSVHACMLLKLTHNN